MRCLAALLLSVLCVCAQGVAWLSTVTKPAPSTGTTYLFQENFEGVGAENTWTNVGNAFTYDATPALAGSHSWGAYTTQTIRCKSVLPTSNFNVWAYCLIRLTNASSLNGTPSIILYDPAGTAAQSYIGVMTTNTLRLYHGLANSTTMGLGNVMTNGTTFHLWYQYASATSGSNGTAAIYWSIDGTKGTVRTNVVTGSSTNRIGQIALGTSDALGYLVDKIRISTSEIGDNPD